VSDNEQVDRYMEMSMGQWPYSLYRTAYNMGKRWGLCGEVLVDAIKVWLPEQRELSADEVKAIWDAQIADLPEE